MKNFINDNYLCSLRVINNIVSFEIKPLDLEETTKNNFEWDSFTDTTSTGLTYIGKGYTNEKNRYCVDMIVRAPRLDSYERDQIKEWLYKDFVKRFWYKFFGTKIKKFFKNYKEN